MNQQEETNKQEEFEPVTQYCSDFEIERTIDRLLSFILSSADGDQDERTMVFALNARSAIKVISHLKEQNRISRFAAIDLFNTLQKLSFAVMKLINAMQKDPSTIDKKEIEKMFTDVVNIVRTSMSLSAARDEPQNAESRQDAEHTQSDEKD